MNDARYVPVISAVNGLTKEQEQQMHSYVNRHPAVRATRFNRDGSHEDFDMPSVKYVDGQTCYHFALVNEFRRTEGIQ